MIFDETPIRGAFRIRIERKSDERGYFARTWCEDEFSKHGLVDKISQCSVSYNEHAGTLRGLHYQIAPHEEVKVVSCVAGKIFDVIVDLRIDSPSYKRWFGVELSGSEKDSLYVPPGVAHGFLTLENSSEVYYQISGRYVAESSRGVLWNDPAFDVRWPATPKIISERDRTFPAYPS